jgi:hypothetical protein
MGGDHATPVTRQRRAPRRWPGILGGGSRRRTLVPGRERVISVWRTGPSRCDEKAADGSVVNWGFEGGSPNSLIRHGVTKATIPTGTELVIQGYQSKAFEHKGVGVNMTFPDGRKFLFGGSAPGAESEVATPTKDEVAPVTKDDSSSKK